MAGRVRWTARHRGTFSGAAGAMAGSGQSLGLAIAGDLVVVHERSASGDGWAAPGFEAVRHRATAYGLTDGRTRWALDAAPLGEAHGAYHLLADGIIGVDPASGAVVTRVDGVGAAWVDGGARFVPGPLADRTIVELDAGGAPRARYPLPPGSPVDVQAAADRVLLVNDGGWSLHERGSGRSIAGGGGGERALLLRGGEVLLTAWSATRLLGADGVERLREPARRVGPSRAGGGAIAAETTDRLDTYVPVRLDTARPTLRLPAGPQTAAAGDDRHLVVANGTRLWVHDTDGRHLATLDLDHDAGPAAGALAIVALAVGGDTIVAARSDGLVLAVAMDAARWSGRAESA